MSQDRAKVNLNRIAARYVVMVISRKDVGIAQRFLCCNYTVGPYGSGPMLRTDPHGNLMQNWT